MLAIKPVGFYTQPYNEIVRPEQIWPVSKYFLRRWIPYLTPTRFWTVIAARQLAYRLGDKRRFSCYDALFYKEANLSRANFYRLKSELDDADSALSLFIRRAPTSYRREGKRTKPGPTTYFVRLDDVLTPADAAHLKTILASADSSVEAVVSKLQETAALPLRDLLAPDISLENSPEQFVETAVIDLVEQLFGADIAQDDAVQKAAEALHTTITAPRFVGTQYFRREWLKTLGAGPAALITYLRSFCFRNEETGELRDTLTFTRPQLANALGVERTTLFRWFKKIDKKTPAAQPFFPFLEPIESVKTEQNEVETTVRVQLHEPLTTKHLETYTKRLQMQGVSHNATEAALQNETNGQPEPLLQNETQTHTIAVLQNETQQTLQIEAAALQNGTRLNGSVANRDGQQAALLQKETGGVAKWDTNKYQSSFFQALKIKDAAADLLDFVSFSRKVAPTWTVFCELVGVQGKTSQSVLENGRLSLAQMVGWYLYALTESGIKPPMLPGYLVNRAREGEPPAAPFADFAHLSWGLWICYGCLLELPLDYRVHLQDAPCLEAWLAVYGEGTAVSLPKKVEVAVDNVLTQLPESQTPEAPSIAETEATHDESQLVWGLVLEELSLQLPKPTFEMWLRDTQILKQEGHHFWIGAESERARDWLTHRLKPVVQRTLSGIVADEVELQFQVVA